jgi:hypothetical protein
MASRFIDDLRWCAKSEVSNTVMLKELDYRGDPDLIRDLKDIMPTSLFTEATSPRRSVR